MAVGITRLEGPTTFWDAPMGRPSQSTLLDQLKEPNGSRIPELSESGKQAISGLYQVLRPQLLRYARRFTGSPELAEDVVDEAFLNVIKAQIAEETLPKRDGTSYIPESEKQQTNLMYNVLSHELTDTYRKQTAAMRDENLTVPLEPVENDIAIEGPEIVAAARDMLRAVFNEITDTQKKIFILIAQGYVYQEIGLKIGEGVSTSTVKNHVFHARMKLKQLFQDEFPDEVEQPEQEI